ncbi:hypothetical protein M9Y10_006578 [Tritrichomonas musculus]|uniref:fructokinase n=1 Tax=Tritrichomonas musculus TaxID=1915356 RepID=A0ABR2JF20_9EUKA
MSANKTVCCVEIGGTTSAKKGITTAFPIRGEDSIKLICNAIKETGTKYSAIGIASFGPLNIAKGTIGNTTKPNWKHFPLVAEFRKNLQTDVPIVLETDVNAPAYSEYLALNERGKKAKAVAYLTVGTGVGLGIFVDGHPIHGALHPEFGHITIDPYKNNYFPGVCPFHGNCFEGVISAHALARRLNIKPEELKDVPNEHPVWDLFAYYIAKAATTAAYSYAIDYFVVGGGIMTGDNRGFLYDKANEYCKNMINGYLDEPIICRPVYNKDAGLVGAAACAFHPEHFQVL